MKRSVVAVVKMGKTLREGEEREYVSSPMDVKEGVEQPEDITLGSVGRNSSQAPYRVLDAMFALRIQPLPAISCAFSLSPSPRCT